MKESTLVRDIRLDLGSHPYCRLFRNNVGRLQNPDGSYIQFGLCPGSSDLIGFRSVVITPDLIGSTLAVFLAIEAKRPGKSVSQDNQMRFIHTVRAFGGRAGFARSVEEARHIALID